MSATFFNNPTEVKEEVACHDLLKETDDRNSIDICRGGEAL